MEHDKKMAFLQNMTHMALTHAAATPNVPTPQGGMSHDKMLSFVSQIATKGLQHFDAGGTALGGPTNAVGPGQNIGAQGVLGGLSNFLGTSNQFQPTGVPIQAGTNVNQLNGAYTGAQGALGTQGQITNTLNSGLNQGTASQNNLTNLYTQQANGQGPNPALASLNQQTGQNIAQQAALAAGQRGAGANAGLIAAQNAQQGAATQQQAVGQAATMQAQQQLAAEGNLQNLAANQVAQGTSATQGLNNAQQNEQNILQGANTSYNNTNVGQQSNLNSTNAQIATGNANTQGNIVGGLLGGASSAIGALFEKGGEVKAKPNMYCNGGYAQGGNVYEKPWKMAAGGIIGEQTSGPQSYVGNWLNSSTNGPGAGMSPQQSNINTAGASPFQNLGAQVTSAADAIKGSSAPNLIQNTDVSAEGAPEQPAIGGYSPTQGYVLGNGNFGTPEANGGLMTKGGNVKAENPSEKAVTKGDSLANDKVPAMLSEGEVVMDKDTLNDPGPVGQMARAVAMHIQKRNKQGKKK